MLATTMQASQTLHSADAILLLMPRGQSCRQEIRIAIRSSIDEMRLELRT